MENKLDQIRLKVGDKLSRISYMTVIEKNFSDVIVKNEDGLEWNIGGDILAKECYSADQFNEIKEVSRTELIEIFNNVGDAVFTVNFDKLPVADDFIALTRDKGQFKSDADLEKAFKKLKGENRTLVGYLVKPENGFGRSLVIELDGKNEAKKAFRQVDHRTINSLISKNVKYVVK